MVAVCRMAPQAALLEQSLAEGHRHPAGSTTRARRSFFTERPSRYTSRDHTGSVALKFTRLVKVANADPKGDILLFEAKSASGDYRGRFLCQRLGLDGIRGHFVS